jgi:iron complex transport system permease protein
MTGTDHQSWAWVIGLTICLAVLATFASGIGQYPISHTELLGTLGYWLGVHDQPPEPTIALVLSEVRLPRVLAAAVTGAVLATAGAVYQGMFRNPLVSPDILGVSTGAGLGAALGILLSLSIVMIQLFAFIGGLITVAVVYLLAARIQRQDPTLILVLSGIVIGSLAGASLSLVKILADPYDQLPAITFWLLGSFAAIDRNDLSAALPACLVALIPMILLRWRMNILSLGDEEARSLGVNPAQTRIILIGAATLMTAAAVAIAGVIGWVGLVIPHIARMIVGPNFSRLLPVAILLGACFMLLVDTVARTLTQTETPIGILTAFIGAPVFVWLLFTTRRGWS